MIRIKTEKVVVTVPVEKEVKTLILELNEAQVFSLLNLLGSMTGSGPMWRELNDLRDNLIGAVNHEAIEKRFMRGKYHYSNFYQGGTYMKETPIPDVSDLFNEEN